MDEISFDFLVVGSGTGMLAALAAAEAGLSVLIVEKTEYFGGSTVLSGGDSAGRTPTTVPAG
ncbi:FAD-binding protein [Actinoplanes sp. NPDC051513]|uniref:FAD-binding protein n=1 Tax=Actinoplanes sp. NPDC051513 TaxID=3363908 RepID=UPI00379A6433